MRPLKRCTHLACTTLASGVQLKSAPSPQSHMLGHASFRTTAGATDSPRPDCSSTVADSLLNTSFPDPIPALAAMKALASRAAENAPGNLKSMGGTVRGGRDRNGVEGTTFNAAVVKAEEVGLGCSGARLPLSATVGEVVAEVAGAAWGT